MSVLFKDGVGLLATSIGFFFFFFFFFFAIEGGREEVCCVGERER